jgi:AraC family transcriptional regulator
VLDLGFATLHETRYPAGQRLAPHEHPFTNVSLVLAGALREWSPAGEHDLGALHLVVKPAGVVHSNEFGPAGARLFTIRFAADFLAGLAEDGERLAYRWLFTPECARAAIAAFRSFRARATEDEGPLTVLAALGDGEPRSVATRQPAWLAHARDLLHAEFARSPTVREVAHRIGVHPVHMTRVFHRHFGCTVGVYLRRLRLQAAATALAEGDLPLARIAAETGFADQPHLTRALRAAGGITPDAYRRLLRG